MIHVIVEKRSEENKIQKRKKENVFLNYHIKTNLISSFIIQ